MRFFVMLQATAIVLLGQTSAALTGSRTDTRSAWEEQLQSLPKMFLPELPSVSGDPITVKPKDSYCVYPAPDRKSISIRRCQPRGRQFRFVTPLENPTPKNNLTK